MNCDYFSYCLLCMNESEFNFVRDPLYLKNTALNIHN